MMELAKKTIGQCLEERAAKTPELVAIETFKKCYTWAELDEISNYEAIRMMEIGIKKGTHVAVWGTNTTNWVIVFLSLEKIGAIPCLINTYYTADELEKVIRYADIQYVYYGQGYKNIDYNQIVHQLTEKLICQVRLWIPMKPGVDGFLSAKSFSKDEKSEEALQMLAEKKAQVTYQDTAAILFTSGTTSIPKGVMLSHYNLVNSSLETSYYMQWNETDKMLIAVPMFHCFGITSSLLSSIHCGFTMRLIEYYRSLIVMDVVQKCKCTLINGVPSMFLALINNADFDKYDLSTLRRGIIAGSAISVEEYMSIRKAIPNLKLHASYGQTETSPCVSIGLVGDSDEINAKAAGRVNENVHVRIVSLTTGEVLPAGEIGEIQVKGYNVMQGYYKLPEATKEAITEDGWLHTGDVGHLDENNYLYMTGRIKEIIIRGGENIAPSEIEAVVKQYPDVLDAKIVGVPAPVLKEQIAACLIVKNRDSFSKEDFLSSMKGKLAQYKIPEYVLLFDEFPVNASGKIMLKDLKAQAEQRVEQIRKTSTRR